MTIESSHQSEAGYGKEARALEIVFAVAGIGISGLIAAMSIFGKAIGEERTNYFDGRAPTVHTLTYFDSKPVQAAILTGCVLVILFGAFASLLLDVGRGGRQGIASMCAVTAIAAGYFAVLMVATGMSWVLASVPVLLF